MKSIKKSLGFTLLEVLIATTIMGAATIAGVSAYKDHLAEAKEEQAVKMSAQLIDAYKKFHTVNRRPPVDVNELISSEYYTGRGTTPWGAPLAGAVTTSGKAFSFTYNAEDSAQAGRLAGEMRHFNAQAAGSIVTFKTPVPTVTTIADQMLCRKAIAGVPGCNEMEVDLDVNDNDLLSINKVEADTVQFNDFSALNGTVNNLTVNQSIILGNSSIGFSPNQININADTTAFTGDIELLGDLTGNNSNISGINTVSAGTISSDNVTSTSGNITSLQGNDLDFDIGDFNDLTSVNTTASIGTFDELNTDQFNANDVNTNTFEGQSGTFDNAQITNASGTNLNLTGALSTNSFSSQNSQLGNVSGNQANFTGQVKGGSFSGGAASFTTVAVNGTVSGGNFYGTDFCTSTACVNSNRNSISQNTTKITQNATKISSNTSSIASNSSKISSNSSKIASNTSSITSNSSKISSNSSKISSNTSSISSNSTKIASNTSSISSNTSRINTNSNSITSINSSLSGINSDIAGLKNRWSVCVSAGGCQ